MGTGDSRPITSVDEVKAGGVYQVKVLGRSILVTARDVGAKPALVTADGEQIAAGFGLFALVVGRYLSYLPTELDLATERARALLSLVHKVRARVEADVSKRDLINFIDDALGEWQ